MAINGIQSSLPDARYIAQLEKELAWARAQIERLVLAVSNKGR